MKRLLAVMLAVFVSPHAMAQGQTPGTLTPETVALGRELAEQGMLVRLLPMVAAKETEEMIADMPDLSEAEKAIFRTTSAEIYAKGVDGVIETQGKTFAIALSKEDLQALTELNRHPASARYRAVLPEIIQGTISGLDGVDFKGGAMAAFCKKTGKGCKAAE